MSRKEGVKRTSFEDYIEALIQGLKGYTKKSKERLIIALTIGEQKKKKKKKRNGKKNNFLEISRNELAILYMRRPGHGNEREASKETAHNAFSRYDTKLHLIMRLQSWKFEGCGVPLSLPLLPGPLWPWVVVSVGVLSMGKIEPFNHLLHEKPFNSNKMNNVE